MDTAVSSAQGIDVSSFQPVLTSTFGKKFIFCKATEGLSWHDPTFAANWKFLGEQVKAGHIAFRGAYHFFHPSLDPVAQAAFFLTVVKAQGLQAGDVLMDDMEILSGAKNQLELVSDRSNLLLRGRNSEAIVRAAAAADYPSHAQGAPLGAMTATAVDAANKHFLDAVAAGGRLATGGHALHTVCYTDLSVGSQLPSSVSYPLFIAYYESHAPASVHPWSSWVFWQFAGGGGPTGADQDAFNGDEAALAKWAGTPTPVPPSPVPPPAPPQEDEMPNGVITTNGQYPVSFPKGSVKRVVLYAETAVNVDLRIAHSSPASLFDAGAQHVNPRAEYVIANNADVDAIVLAGATGPVGWHTE